MRAGTIPSTLESKYKAGKPNQVYVDTVALYTMGVKAVKSWNVVLATSYQRMRHDPDQIGKGLVELFKEWTEVCDAMVCFGVLPRDRAMIVL